ncbi:DUF1572 domain-containing protein [Mucilaginibacter sp. HMF5004]|nr:DUF1572 domain-containing protein [Mucilaginibacter rivuli]
MDDAGSNYLENVKKLFRYYKTLGDAALERTAEEGLHWQFDAGSNSIATIVKHISGNSLSRWTDFLTSDGEKDWRDRDDEFEDTIASKEELTALWNKGWQCLFNAVDPLTDADLLRTVYIRGQAHTVIEAINRQLAHIPYHIGQMVTLAKMMAGEGWKSLTIPKGESKNFRQVKFLDNK